MAATPNLRTLTIENRFTYTFDVAILLLGRLISWVEIEFAPCASYFES